MGGGGVGTSHNFDFAFGHGYNLLGETMLKPTSGVSRCHQI